MIFTATRKVSIFSIFILGLTTFLMYASYQVKFGQEINQPTHSNSTTGKSTSWKWFTALDAYRMNYTVIISIKTQANIRENKSNLTYFELGK